MPTGVASRGREGIWPDRHALECCGLELASTLLIRSSVEIVWHEWHAESNVLRLTYRKAVRLWREFRKLL